MNMTSGAMLFLLGIMPCQSEVKKDPPPWYEDRKQLLYFKDGQGRLQPVKSMSDWSKRVAHIRENMELVMGPLPVTTTLPLDMKIDHEEKLQHYTRKHVSFLVEKEDRVPAFLLIPHHATKNSLRPGVICLPGSSKPGKDIPAGVSLANGQSYAHELASRGYVCLVMDYPLLHTNEYPADPYKMGYASATMKGIVNHRRGIDLLSSLGYVDSGSIGVIGHSLGGHNALFLGVFDQRIKAVASSCGFNVFAKHNKGDVRAWSSKYYMPRIKTEYNDIPSKIPFDFTEVLAALAPRPVFINAPLHDEPDFEVSGVTDCIDAALPVYEKIFNFRNRLEVHHPDTNHSFPLRERLMAYAFFDKHLMPGPDVSDIKDGLISHLPLVDNARDISGKNHHAESVNVHYENGAFFNGMDSSLKVAKDIGPQMGKGEFSIACWIKADDKSNVLPGGDIFSWYSPNISRGVNLSLKSNQGVTTNQANYRHLFFGIDNNKSGEWHDCGVPGKALCAFSLAVHGGELYAGTCAPEANDSGRVYRHAGAQRWIDCGAPDKSNSVMSLAIYENQLYAGTGKYRLAGSALSESKNTNLGGRILRYEGRDVWKDCGQLPDTEAVGGMVVYKGKLYASSLYKPAGFYRYEGNKQWTKCPTPVVEKSSNKQSDNLRVEALTVFGGFIYASSYDCGNVFRFDGEKWIDLGRLGENTQTYSFAIYQGALHVGTWPSGRVYRLEKTNQWTDLGRLGEELEVMGMVVNNGKLLAGTLPLAEVYEYSNNKTWKKITRLDHTPDVKYRRAWTMAEHDGRLFCSTLPSGKIFSFETGRNVSWGHSLPAGWHHLAAIKTRENLMLYLDGCKVSESTRFKPDDFQIVNDAVIQIGAGASGNFRGWMSDLRIYNQILDAESVKKLAAMKPMP
ncbi:MAG: hypothetical protein RL179_744 [Planctomycetota bacterium]|jgi:dienelactone hydrolase